MITLINIYKVPESPKILYDLLIQRSTEDDPYVNISHRKLPSWRDHLRFVDSRPYRCWYLIQADGQTAGTTYISKRNEIGIVLFTAHRGKGYGLEAVNALITKHKPLKAIPGKRSGRFLANINPQNERSKRLFQKLGFVHIQETYAL